MTKKIEYVCNICRSTYNPEIIYGIYFNSKYFTLYKYTDLQFKDCETHICERCLNQLIIQYSKEFHE